MKKSFSSRMGNVVQRSSSILVASRPSAADSDTASLADEQSSSSPPTKKKIFPYRMGSAKRGSSTFLPGPRPKTPDSDTASIASVQSSIAPTKKKSLPFRMGNVVRRSSTSLSISQPPAGSDSDASMPDSSQPSSLPSTTKTSLRSRMGNVVRRSSTMLSVSRPSKEPRLELDVSSTAPRDQADEVKPAMPPPVSEVADLLSPITESPMHKPQALPTEPIDSPAQVESPIADSPRSLSSGLPSDMPLSTNITSKVVETAPTLTSPLDVIIPGEATNGEVSLLDNEVLPPEIVTQDVAVVSQPIPIVSEEQPAPALSHGSLLQLDTPVVEITPRSSSPVGNESEILSDGLDSVAIGSSEKQIEFPSHSIPPVLEVGPSPFVSENTIEDISMAGPNPWTTHLSPRSSPLQIPDGKKSSASDLIRDHDDMSVPFVAGDAGRDSLQENATLQSATAVIPGESHASSPTTTQLFQSEYPYDRRQSKPRVSLSSGAYSPKAVPVTVDPLSLAQTGKTAKAPPAQSVPTPRPIGQDYGDWKVSHGRYGGPKIPMSHSHEYMASRGPSDGGYLAVDIRPGLDTVLAIGIAVCKWVFGLFGRRS